MAVLLLAACHSQGTKQSDIGPGSPAPQRSVVASAEPTPSAPTPRQPSAGAAQTETQRLDARVGALTYAGEDNDHFCTASAVRGAGGNLVMTAAHCVSALRQRARSSLTFIPDYQDGSRPHGVWKASRIFVDPQWASEGDPELDVAFVVVRPPSGSSLESVVGTNDLAFNQGGTARIRVVGYPNDTDSPTTCERTLTSFDRLPMTVACPGFSNGTSGSPWIDSYDPRTGRGTVVGLIGGFQQGGNDPDVSYSPYFGNAVRALYLRAARSAG